MKNEFQARLFRLRIAGKEYGPFTEDQVRAWLEGRKVSDEDALWDPATGDWTPLSSWLPVKEEEPGAWDNMLSKPADYTFAYSRIMTAGLFLALFWGLLFGGYRVYTGKWPLRTGAPSQSRVVVDTDSSGH